MAKTRKYIKQIADGAYQKIRIGDIANAESISEYFYYKGLIRGLREGNMLDENKLTALIATYEVKTRYFDKLLEKEDEVENEKNI